VRRRDKVLIACGVVIAKVITLYLLYRLLS
jgi:hypothetical protein